ncbi:MAG TPA: hypothetical protein DD435_03110 [Cyanobacteria bacterium UBA8530]|nr:hypothetical protein [Cyanobacteria bacterium UBA8530]
MSQSRNPAIKDFFKKTMLIGMFLAVGCGVQAPFSPLAQNGAGTIDAKAHKPGELELQVFPGAGLDRMLASIKEAKKTVQMEMYMITLEPVINELIAAADRGVKVQVQLEANPFNPNNPSAPLPTNQIAARKFKDTKVQLAWTDPSFNFTHAKCLIVDDTAWILSLNLTKSAIEQNREFAIVDKSPSDVAELKNIFKSDWLHEAYVPKDQDLVISPVNSRKQIFDVVQSAKKELLIGVEVAGDPQTDELIAQTLKKGVHLRIILAHYKKIDCNLEIGKKWKSLGAEVRFLGKPFYHAKYLVADGKAGYMGSVNLTTNSMDSNREVGVIIKKDATILGAFTKVFDTDWAAAEPCP